LFVLGLAEGVLPALPVDNPVIDFHERRRLAQEGIDFEEAADIPRWESLAFFSLLATATHSLTLTYPKTIGKEEKLPSSFFKLLGLEITPTHPTVLASQVEFVRNTLRKNVDSPIAAYVAAARQLDVERRRESGAAHDEYDGVIGDAIDVAGRQWSVSQLTTLAGCGFRWFAGYGLRVKPADEMELEVSPAARGKLFHYALDFAVAQGKAKTREEIIHLLDHALASGYNQRDVGMPRLPNWDMRRADYVAELTRAVESADFLPAGSEIAATEQEFLVMLHDLRIRGRIDRVDRSAQGITAVDYKTSSKKPDAVRDREGRKLDLQIAVYLNALAELYPDENIAGGVYYSLSSRKYFPAEPADDAELKNFLVGVVDAPKTGSLAVRPISKKTCEYCDYDQLCRNGSRIARKEASAQ
jgi:ATP-dependent helicase/DNAse subunit B